MTNPTKLQRSAFLQGQSNRSRKAAVCILALMCVAAAQGASSWSGLSGNWSSNASPGWNGTGVPNAVGAIADLGSTVGTKTIGQDVSGLTLGTLTMGGSGNFTSTLTLTNSITLNQDGASSGFATISNTDTGTGVNRLSIGSGTITLADDLLVSNSGGSTNSSGAITFSGILAGTGNVTFDNVSNNLSAGAINFSGANTFSGTVLIQRGAVLAGGLGNAANQVTLGSSGNSASLATAGSATSIANKITVAATTGTNVLGSTNAGSTNSTFSGNLLLNGGVKLTSVKTAGGAVLYTGTISGVGSIVTAGTGATEIGNASANITNTYSGNTTLTETSSLLLSDNAKLTFYIGANGVNNQITGSANQVLTLDGDFVFDLTGAASSGSWNIVDVANLSETFSASFTVVGFTEASNVWTKTAGATTYSFSEATGVLTASVPEPSALALVGVGIAMVLYRRRKR